MMHPSVVRRQRVFVGLLLGMILITVVAGMGLGASSLSYDRLIPVLLGQGTFKEQFVLFSIRMPRIVVTLLAGMALALSGAILQGITRNDLADPGIVGINSGAGVAVTVFFLYAPLEVGSFVYMLPVVAFSGALLAACLIYLFAYRSQDGGVQPVKLVLVGIGFAAALAGAMIVLISSAERTKVDFIARWLAGNIWGTDWPFVGAMLPWLALLVPVTLLRANRLNVLGLGEAAAVGVGVSVRKERIVQLFSAVALAASAVSVTGSISFIGLLSPHMAKALVGPRHQLSLPVAILLGGWLLLLADTAGRNLAQPNGIPAGVMAALIGAPYFVYLLLRK